MKAFAQHFAFEFRTTMRNRQLVFLNTFFPLGFYLLMGFIMGSINPGFIDDMIPAMVVFAVVAATMLGVPELLVGGRTLGIFRSYKINGVPAFSILIIPALTSMFQLFLIAVVIAVTAPLLFDASLPTNWLMFLVIFLVSAFACTGLGVLIGTVSPNSRVSMLWAQLVFVPSMLLGGMMMPYSILPEVAGKAAQLFPATHTMNAFRALAMGKPEDFSAWGSVGVLLLTGLLAIGLALYLFSWDDRNTKRRGPIWLALLVLLPAVVGILIL